MQIPTLLSFCACCLTVTAAIFVDRTVASGLDLRVARDLDLAAVRFNK
jgi:hypothetical protein